MTSYQLGLYEKSMPADLKWLEKLSYAKAAGFDYLELSIDETDAKLQRLDMKNSELQDIISAMTDTKLPIRSICLSAHRKYPLGASEPSVRRRSLEIMEKAIALAVKLGVRTIQLAGYDVYYETSSEETREYFLGNLHKAVNMAAAEGIYLGFETMETPFMDTVAKAMKYVTVINSPYLGVYPDSGNITNAAQLYGKSLEADIFSGQGHILAFHLKEALPNRYREIPFGTGHVDFQLIIRHAWSIGVRRYVAEFWYAGEADWQGELKRANDFLRAFFANLK